MSKEKEIIKSFLKSNFNWVCIGSDQGWGQDCGRAFEGMVCPRAVTSYVCVDKGKALKTWNKIEDCKEWFPENILNKSILSYGIDKTGKQRRWDQMIKDIDADTKLLIEINQGSISGAGFGNGWSIRIGLVYKCFMFKLYDFKASGDQFNLDAYYDLDYLRSLDFSDMNKLIRLGDDYLYFSEYYIISTYNRITNQDMADVLSLVMDGDTITFSDSFIFNFCKTQGISADSGCMFGRETLNVLNPKKIILQGNFDIKKIFDIPQSLDEIILDFKVDKWGRTSKMEDFIDQNKDLGKYLKCSSDCEKIEAREIYNKEVEKSRQGVNFRFEYKELKGFVHSNQYQLGLLEEFYKDKEWVELKVADFVIEIPIEEFWDCLDIEEKIKRANKLSKGMEYFGHENGYTEWFPKECRVYPIYKFEKEAQEL